MIAIEASILSADYTRLGEQAREAELAGVEGIQIDIMDGQFVPNITFGWDLVGAVRAEVAVLLDVHLMIVDPGRYLKEFAEAGTDRLFVHQEACCHLHRVLDAITDLGMEAGVALNPATSLSAIEEVLELADIIQVMAVNPGFGGQEFIQGQLGKIRRLRQMLDERGLHTPIAVDGGIDPSTAPLVVKAGGTVLVAGSSIYNESASVADNVAALRNSIRLQ
jgi:ribulose-phosphate 3-epimerase